MKLCKGIKNPVLFSETRGLSNQIIASSRSIYRLSVSVSVRVTYAYTLITICKRMLL